MVEVQAGVGLVLGRHDDDPAAVPVHGVDGFACARHGRRRLDRKVRIERPEPVRHLGHLIGGEPQHQLVVQRRAEPAHRSGAVDLDAGLGGQRVQRSGDTRPRVDQGHVEVEPDNEGTHPTQGRCSRVSLRSCDGHRRRAHPCPPRHRTTRCSHGCARAQVEGRAPSLMAGVVRDGGLVWIDRTRQHRRRTRRPTDTQYRIGSITKPFTAVLVMRLRDEGLLDLDDRVDKHVPGTAVGDRTIRELLAHSSGLAAEPPGAGGSARPARTGRSSPGPSLSDVLLGPPGDVPLLQPGLRRARRDRRPAPRPFLVRRAA